MMSSAWHDRTDTIFVTKWGVRRYEVLHFWLKFRIFVSATNRRERQTKRRPPTQEATCVIVCMNQGTSLILVAICVEAVLRRFEDEGHCGISDTWNAGAIRLVWVRLSAANDQKAAQLKAAACFQDGSVRETVQHFFLPLIEFTFGSARKWNYKLHCRLHGSRPKKSPGSMVRQTWPLKWSWSWGSFESWRASIAVG